MYIHKVANLGDLSRVGVGAKIVAKSGGQVLKAEHGTMDRDRFQQMAAADGRPSLVGYSKVDGVTQRYYLQADYLDLDAINAGDTVQIKVKNLPVHLDVEYVDNQGPG